MPKRPTMSDIARIVGVSQATVSLVLNNALETRISKQTRGKVLAVAAELGYSKTPRSHNGQRVIALLINDLTSTQHGASLLEGARDEAAENDAIVVVVPTDGSRELEAEALDYLLGRQVIGVIYATLLTQAVKLPDRLEGVPTVLLNCHAADTQIPSVIPGDVAGGFAATKCLLDAGHKRIALIKGEDVLEAAQNRLLGYRRALITHDIAVDPELVLSGGWNMAAGRAQTNRLLDLPNPPTAIFCYNDRLAFGAYEAARARGLKIPEDISIVGFDDEKYAADMAPPLTTLKLPHESMARWAVNEVLEMQSGRSSGDPISKIKLECSLIIRKSVGPHTGPDLPE